MKLAIAILLCFAAICHGETPSPVRVTVPQLIATPERSNGKKISTIGYYTAEHHGVFLCANAKTALKGTVGAWRIYLDFEHTSLPGEALKRVPHGYVKIIGTFEYRNMTIRGDKDGMGVLQMGFGWMNVYDKQITKISEFTPVPSPKG